MKKFILFITFIVGLLSVSSVFGAFERLRNFFGGGRYYYYDDGYYYPAGRRYYTYSYPYYYARPRYYYEPIVNVPTVDTKMSVNEDDNNYSITIVLPGYNKSDINVSALERSIQINANAPKTVTIQGSTLPTVGSIEQVIPLNSLIKPEAVTTRYENGILTIIAPKYYARAVSVPVE